MEITFVCKPKKHLSTIVAPSSKSVMQRIVAGSVFCKDPVTIYRPSYCQDSLAALTMANALGVFKLESCDTTILKQTQQIGSNILDCSDSGLAFRMFLPIAAAFGGNFDFLLGESLQKRPVKLVEDVLKQSNISTKLSQDSSIFSIGGKLKSGAYKMDGSISSQLLTGMLMALPVLDGDSIIEVENLKSRPYIDLTLQILSEFGICIENYEYQKFIIQGNQKYITKSFTIEGDWSQTAFALVLGAVSQSVSVKNLNLDSLQPDRAILSVLKDCGASIVANKKEISVAPAELKLFEFDADHAPDLVPPLTFLAACCQGVSKIYHIDRLKFKESDRVSALIELWTKLGISIQYEADSLRITGGKIGRGIINSYNDHRIAMTAGMASFVSTDPIEVIHPQCVEKSYPDFWKVFFE